MRQEIGETRRLAYTVAEAAVLTTLSIDRLYAAIGEGKLVVKRYGQRTLIPIGRLEAFIDGLEDVDLSPGPRKRGRKPKRAA